MRTLIGISIALLLLLALDFYFQGGKYFTTLTIFIDNVTTLLGR